MMTGLRHFLQTKWQHINQVWYDKKRNTKLSKVRQTSITKAIILTSPNTLYVADLIQNALNLKNIQSTIITKKPIIGYEDCLHFVIAAHSFKKLPTFYVAFQLEQYVSGVFNKTKRVKKLQNAILLMDYSLKNIQYLLRHGFKAERLYHVPIAQCLPKKSILKPSYEYDIVFYGDTKIERRQHYLKALGRHFKLNIITNIFGHAAIEELSKAKIVVNIHYYENSLLETTRLFECISNNLLVISEDASDMEEHSQLNGIVDFVETGNIQQMIERVNYWLTHESEWQTQLYQIQQFAAQKPTSFEKQFDKVLTYLGSEQFL